MNNNIILYNIKNNLNYALWIFTILIKHKHKFIYLLTFKFIFINFLPFFNLNNKIMHEYS